MGGHDGPEYAEVPGTRAEGREGGLQQGGIPRAAGGHVAGLGGYDRRMDYRESLIFSG